MKRSIATVSVSGTLVEKLNAIRQAGFDGAEIFDDDLRSAKESPADVRRIAADLGLELVLYQPFRDFEGVSAERLAHNLERAQRTFDVMHELGIDRLLLCSNVSSDAIGDDSLIGDQLGTLARAARASGIVVGYEALAWGRHVNRHGHAWRIVQAVGDSNLGLALDSFHTFSRGDSADDIASIPGERIAFVQLADAPTLALDVLEWSRHHRCFPGHGDFDMVGFTARVIESGYSGPLSLEIFNDAYRAAPPAGVARDGYCSLLELEERARSLLAAESTSRSARPAPSHVTRG